MVLAEGILGYSSTMLLIQKYSNPFSPKENSKKKVSNVVLGSQYLGKKLEVDLVFYSGWRYVMSVVMSAVLSDPWR